MTGETPHKKGRSGAIQAALFAECPQCGSRTLFGTNGLFTKELETFSQFTRRCRVCGLDFSKFNVGDGPAAFLTLIIGAVVVGLAMWLEITIGPPFWVHILLWVPLTAAAVLYGLRVGKAALLQAEYRNSAGEAGAADLGDDE